MSGPYLHNIRPGGDTKRRLRRIMTDVADRFDVRAAVDPRPVPHVTLFGPYRTDDGLAAKRMVKDTLAGYDVVPYRIDGFGRFDDSGVVYANVVPSPELRSLRRGLSRRLRRIADDHGPHDTDYFYEFHATIAFRDVGDKLDDVYEYVSGRYHLRSDEYATRVTSLRGREMLWEYDVPRNEELRPDEATSAASWEATERRLNERRSPADHDDLSPRPGWSTRVVRSAAVRATFRW